MTRKVGVLVVDDSPLCRQLIVDALTADSDIEVIGTAENGEEAIAKAKSLKPAVITMDVDMPVLDGLSATEQIMAETPTPILVLTGDPRREAPGLTHRALAVGALALQVKPAMDAGPDAWNLAREIKLLSTVKVIRHLRGTRRTISGLQAAAGVEPESTGAFISSPVGVVAIASSTGGPQVVQKLLAELPPDFPSPVVLVQHINAAFAESLVSWLAASSKLKVQRANDGDLLQPGTVFIAPPGAHLTIPSRGKLSVKPGKADDVHTPSGTMLLESAATAYGRRAVGVLLTGMGTDGVDGLAAIHKVGGKTLAQSQESCIVYGMPGAAVAKGVVTHIVHGDDLSRALVKLARGQELPKSG